jgi:hypothetical protein
MLVAKGSTWGRALSGELTHSHTAPTSVQQYARTCAAVIGSIFKGIGIVFDFIAYFVTFPEHWLLTIIESAEQKLRLAPSSSVRALRWTRLQILRLARFAAHWSSKGVLFLIIIFCYGFACWVLVKPFIWSEWVGAIWGFAILVWLFLGVAKLLPELNKVAFVTAIGVTPQFLFLVAHNGFIEGQMVPPAILQGLIHEYEFIAVWLYTQLEPLHEITWYWWALGAVLLLLTAYLLDNAKLLSRALALRSALASFLFLATITSSLTLSTAIPVSNWEPDLQARLKARLAEEVRYETELNLAVELQKWFETHRNVPNAIPVYSRTFGEALKQLGYDVNDETKRLPRDVVKATRDAMKELVPKNLGDTLGQRGTNGDRGGRKVSASVSELLSLDREMKDRSVVLKERADQARETAVNFIAQVVEVSAPLKPFVRAIVDEVINASAEILSARILERIPIEAVVKKSEQVSNDVRSKISDGIDLLAVKLFSISAAERAVLGVKVEPLRERIAEETRRLTVAREVEAARARARVRAVP